MKALLLPYLLALTALASKDNEQEESVLYKQCDPRWGGEVIKQETVCKVGCLISSIAMALAYNKIGCAGFPCDPGHLVRFLKKNDGFTEDDLYKWETLNNKLATSYVGQMKDIEEIVKTLQAKFIVVLNVDHGRHWVWATSFDQETGIFNVKDPYWDRTHIAKKDVLRAGVYKRFY